MCGRGLPGPYQMEVHTLSIIMVHLCMMFIYFLISQCHGNPDDDSTSSSSEDDNDGSNVTENMNGEASSSRQNDTVEPMDEDQEPGWMVVRSRRKK